MTLEHTCEDNKTALVKIVKETEREWICRIKVDPQWLTGFDYWFQITHCPFCGTDLK